MWYEERLTKDNKKRYIFYERYTDPLTGKTKKVSITVNNIKRPTIKFAETELKNKIHQKINTPNATITNYTFKEVATEWLGYVINLKKLATYKRYENQLEQIYKLLPKDILIKKLNTIIVQDLINTIYLKNNKSYGYSKSFLLIIKQILTYAQRLSYIESLDFLQQVELKRKPISVEDIYKLKNNFLLEDEIVFVFDFLRKYYFRIALAMEFLLLTGLRFGEEVALRITDCDFQKEMVNINGTIVQCVPSTSDDLRGTPKNIYSYREVGLPKRGIVILKFFIADNKRMAWNYEGYIDKGYIFTSNRGNPLNLQYVNRILRKIKLPSGKKVSTHIFRHTHISILANMNVPIKAIMERVGHNDPRTTLSVYAHVSPATKKDVINKLNNYNVI